MGIYGNVAGGFGMPKTFVIIDENENEITGVVVGEEVKFTATDKQVADGYVYAGESGISTGSREFLAYRTTQSNYLVLPGESFSILLDKNDKWNYTKFHCIIAKFNTTIDDSVYTDRIAIGDNVYAVNSTEPLATITKNADTKSIDLNITNNTDDLYIIYYTTYKEEEL